MRARIGELLKPSCGCRRSIIHPRSSINQGREVRKDRQELPITHHGVWRRDVVITEPRPLLAHLHFDPVGSAEGSVQELLDGGSSGRSVQGGRLAALGGVADLGASVGRSCQAPRSSRC